jgi:hypothetical protein
MLTGPRDDEAMQERAIQTGKVTDPELDHNQYLRLIAGR